MFFSITNVQRTMTCIVMGKCYIKTGVNVNNCLVQRASVSRRSVFVTSIMWMIALLYIMCDLKAFGGFKLSTGGGRLAPGYPSSTLTTEFKTVAN